jgi:hypothetical protein
MAEHKRGRPTVAQTIYGDYADMMEEIWQKSGLKTKRSTADYLYCVAALSAIKEAASEIPHIETICRLDGSNPWYSRSILSQLGRMILQDGYSEQDVLAIAKLAAEARHADCTVRQIEIYIRKTRKTGEW